MIEKRKARRYPIILPALCWSRHRKDFYAVTENISVGGIMMRSSIMPGLDEEFVVSIRQIGGARVRVVRADGHCFGVRIQSLDWPATVVSQQLLALSGLRDGPGTRPAGRSIARPH